MRMKAKSKHFIITIHLLLTNKNIIFASWQNIVNHQFVLVALMPL
jgi:hypothetical protein